MKVKLDFITNSSSTSFIVVVGEEFQKEKFLRILGVDDKSGFKFVFEKLYEKLKSYMTPAREHYLRYQKQEHKRKQYNKFEDYIKDNFSEEVLKKVLRAEKKGHQVYIGRFSSDQDEIECFFCCDSFLIENNKLYINGLNCTW